MEDLELRAQQLREELRNERRGDGTIERSRSASEGSRSANVAFRPNSENTRANTTEASRDTGIVDGDDRGTQGKPKRSRQNRRRLIDNGGSSSEGSREATIVGLERVDSFDFKATESAIGRRKKASVQETVGAFKEAIFRKKGSVLSEKEAKEYKEILPRLIQGYGETTDQALVGFFHCDMPAIGAIWGNITDTEALALSNVLLKRGMRSAQAAGIVRKMIEGEDYVTVGVMMLPRIQLTVEVMRAREK